MIDLLLHAGDCRDVFEDISANGVRAYAGRRTYGRVDKARLKQLFEDGKSDFEIASAFGCSLASVFAWRRKLGLLRRRGRQEGKHRNLSRHAPKSLNGHIATMPPMDHPALSEFRTIYPSTVVSAKGLLNLLIRGDNSWKIGGEITKGRWRGFPVYTLTLEERATCPPSCAHWRSCYGNGMNWAKRIRHDADFETRLECEIGVLSFRHPKGFAVRLHVLGDFYSVAYVALWRSLIDRFANLHVFGFSARFDGKADPIAFALIDLVKDHWARFAIRFSNAPVESYSTVTIEHPLQKPADAIVCPQQLGKTSSCGTCGLCWATRRRIAFLRH